MVDRHDIDALLIGSLYGELSPADEARLKAHLESHPADRTALDGLTRARDAVRASRIFEVQAEPPQAISALLLQEAARRAPRKADAAGEGWFARLRRSFLMSPAFAAAAMLVVVVGAAGTLYLRKGDHFVSPEVSATAEQAAGSASAAPPPAPAPEPDTATVAAVQAQAAQAQAEIAQARAQAAAQDASRSKLAVAGRADADSSYRVGLADGKDVRGGEEQDKNADDREAAPAPAPSAPRPAPAKAEQAKLVRQAGPSSLLEVSTPDRAPKELEEERVAKAAPKKGRAYARPADVEPAAEPAPITANATKLDRAPAGRSPGAAPPAPAPAAPAVAQDLSRAGAAPSSGALGGAAGPGGGGAVDPDYAWAKEQHSRLITQVKAGRCGDAAGTAVALSSRAPGYYQQNVENDRAVKSCLAYINAERERAADRAQRARATTRRVTDEDATASKKAAAPARAAAPAKAAPARPAQAKSAPAKADAAATKPD